MGEGHHGESPVSPLWMMGRDTTAGIGSLSMDGIGSPSMDGMLRLASSVSPVWAAGEAPPRDFHFPSVDVGARHRRGSFVPPRADREYSMSIAEAAQTADAI